MVGRGLGDGTGPGGRLHAGRGRDDGVLGPRLMGREGGMDATSMMEGEQAAFYAGREIDRWIDIHKRDSVVILCRKGEDRGEQVLKWWDREGGTGGGGREGDRWTAD